MSDSQLFVWARDIETGEQWTFQDASQCPVLDKGLTGDGTITQVYEFTQFKDRRPPRFAHVEAVDNQGVVQTGRLVRWQPPGTDLCSGPCTLTAEGYGAALNDVKNSDSWKYGPVWTGTSHGLTPEAAIDEAVSRLGAGLVTVEHLDTTSFVLPDTEDFQGRAAIDVVNTMSGFAAGLATPIMWSVRSGRFRWEALDLGARYQTTIADGAVITPADDASRIYTDVLVIGNGFSASWPTTISYTQLPSRVTLVVNAGSEVKTPAAALQLAQGLYGRLSELELGWSWNFTIPGQTAVDLVGTGPISPWRMESARVLRVPDFEGGNRYGTKHGPPNQMLVTSARWDGNANQLTGSCGEIRDPSAFVRRVLSAGTPSVIPLYQAKPGEMRAIRDAGKIETYGPRLSTSTSDPRALTPGASTSPALVDPRIPSVVSEYNQPPISHESPKPIKVEKGAQDSSGFTTGLLDTGRYWSDVPPCEIDTWYLSASPSGSLSLEVYTASTNSSGFQTDASGDLVPGTLVLTATLSGAKFGLHRFSTSTSPSTNSKPRITAQSIFLYKLTSISNSTAFQITMNGNRIVPNHPGGFNTAPALGKASP